jgi:hypothetical protein
LALERTVGDWLGELAGAAVAGFVFAVFVAGTVYYFFSESAGRSHTDSFFLAAEKRGYRTTYYQPALPDGTRAIASQIPEPPKPKIVAQPPNSDTTPVATLGESQSNGNVADSSHASTNGGDEAKEPVRPSRPAGSPTEYVWRKARPLWAHFFPESIASVPTTVSIEVEPRRVGRAFRTLFRSSVIADGKPVVNGSIEFSVNGNGAGRIMLDVRGMAATHFSTYIAGTYTITARYTGTTGYAASVSSPATLIVE